MAATVDGFKNLFDRGQFTYGTTIPDVRDKDIESAFTEASSVFNSDLYPDEDTSDLCYYYLSAHFLWLDIEGAESGGAPVFIANSHSADGLSESLHIPDDVKQNGFSNYQTTWYGQKFMMLTEPYLGGAIYAVGGRTRP